MRNFLFITTLILASPAHAEFGFGGQQPGKPQSMMVAGDSVIDENNNNSAEAQAQQSSSSRQEVRDDANDMMKPERTAPATQDIDPFSPAPQTAQEQQKNVKRVLKKVPAAKAERSIADDRIDDGYVQQMMKKNFTFTDPIE